MNPQEILLATFSQGLVSHFINPKLELSGSKDINNVTHDNFKFSVYDTRHSNTLTVTANIPHPLYPAMLVRVAKLTAKSLNQKP